MDKEHGLDMVTINPVFVLGECRPSAVHCNLIGSVTQVYCATASWLHPMQFLNVAASHKHNQPIGWCSCTLCMQLRCCLQQLLQNGPAMTAAHSTEALRPLFVHVFRSHFGVQALCSATARMLLPLACSRWGLCSRQCCKLQLQQLLALMQ